MSLASIVKPVFGAYATTIGEAMTCRRLVSGSWTSTSNIYAEIKATFIGEEYDEISGSRVKRQRATAKVYDITGTDAPTLRLGDEIIDASGTKWKVDRIDKAEIGNGIYRYQIVYDKPLRGEVDRGGFQAEGGTPAATSGEAMPSFTAENVDSVEIKAGMLVHRTTLGVLRARNDLAGYSADGMATIDTAVGDNCTVTTENAFSQADWTNIIGSTTFTLDTNWFLSATPGKMATTVPSSGWLQFLGSPLSTSNFDLRIAQAIRL